MNKICFLFCMILMYSCHEAAKDENNVASKPKVTTAVIRLPVNYDSITKDFDTWYSYSYYDVQLSQDFIPLSSDSAVLTKSEFVNLLARGTDLAFKIGVAQGKPVFKLRKAVAVNQSIKEVSQQTARKELEHMKMEGMELPNLDVTDLNGNSYNKKTTLGKILVLKCWFIGCVACVEEFPQVNALVDQNRLNTDVLFVSLAFDSKQKLRQFLAKKELKYATIPGMQQYMTSQLKVSEYPTHLLVNRSGKIVKVVNRIEELVPFLQRELANDAG